MEPGRAAEELLLEVDEVPRTVEALPGASLLDLLRDGLGAKGVRAGCTVGSCGACTVLVDDRPTRSCVMPAREAEGRRITTPGALGSPESPGTVASAFLDLQAAQCGYCINGMIMTVEGLRRAAVTRGADVHAALDEHICRCGAHVRILAAAERALGIACCDVTTCSADRGGAVTHRRDDIVDPAGGTPRELPEHVQRHPDIADWLVLHADGSLTVMPGKVEIGQGILTALTQIAAAQLGMPSGSVRVRPTTTGSSPDQRLTAGSLSIEEAGMAVAFAGAAMRRVVLQRASEVLGNPVPELSIQGPSVIAGDGLAVPLADVLRHGPISGPILATDEPHWGPPVGEALARTDLPAKLSGEPAYVHDVDDGDLVHARVLLPPHPEARLAGAATEHASAMPGVLEVVIDGRLVLILADSSLAAGRALESLRTAVRWQTPASHNIGDVRSTFRALPSERLTVRDDPAGQKAEQERWLASSYFTPYQSHASIAPAVAVARMDEGRLTVWSPTQGPYPLRRELAALLGLDPETITVRHADGPGCYGMNGADDAAALAAIAALRVPGRTVRLGFSVDDELSWAPQGTAMVLETAASVDPDGRIRRWEHRGITDVHKARPNGSGNMLIPAWLRAGGQDDRPWPGPEEGGHRNAVPFYDIPSLAVHVDFVRGPVRTSSLRCLGAFGNLFAVESFIDELADLSGIDPVEFRRRNLSDERALAVLELATTSAGWTPRTAPSGRGMGVAVARYKGKAYVAVVAEVEVDGTDGTIRVRRLTIACDAGRVINPDGLRNQIQGGALQGMSRAMFESFTPTRSTRRPERDWTNYPVIGFADVPVLAVHLIDRPGLPSLGAGEASTPVVAPALANAIDDAIGVRLRDLPMTPASLEQRLLGMSQDEAARALLA